MAAVCVLEFNAVETSHAATNWVSTSGNNTTGNGSSSNPYATIQKAIDVSATGDLIMLKAGTYSGTGNANLSINNESLMVWSESGPSSTIIDAGRQKILTASHSGDPSFVQRSSFHGITFSNGYMTYGGDWNHDSLVSINTGALEFYDCVFKQNEVKASYVTANVFILATAPGASTNSSFFIKNSLFASNTIGCGGWVNSIGGGGGGVLMGPTNCVLDRDTFVQNNLYAATSGNGTRRVLDGGFVTNILVLSNGSLHQPNFPSGSLASYAVSASKPVGYSYVDVPGTSQPYTNSLTNIPIFVNAASGNFDPASNSPTINAGDPASPRNPNGSRADIGYSSARVLSGSNWVNALPAFTNNAFTGGTLDQWEVDGGGTRTVQNDANATDGKSAYIYELAVGVKLRSPAFVCGEGWRARARYRNPGGLSSCGFIVYDAANNGYLLGANLEDDAYATKEYDLSRFAGQTIKVGVAGGNVVLDFIEVLATVPSLPPGWDFEFGFTNINETGAQTYLVGTNRVKNYTEWQSPPLTYWGPDANNIDASLTYRFNVPQTIVKGRLKGTLDSYNFPWPGYYGSGKGWSSFWGSTNGTNLVLLMDNPRPTDNVGRGMTYDQLLPAELMGSKELWVQVRLLVTEAPNSSYTTAQFARGTSANTNRTFEVKLDYDGVTEILSGTSPQFNSTNSFGGTVGVAFSNTVTASGTTPIIFGGANLPTGLSISTN